ncbi:hypothetical protein CBFG_01674 [Clostridiales bacterium 1_7_47FAA]|nr:hypothetical protein CBFG_01674 [Clostridiales bacterium 1_7_47FAA]
MKLDVSLTSQTDKKVVLQFRQKLVSAAPSCFYMTSIQDIM